MQWAAASTKVNDMSPEAPLGLVCSMLLHAAVIAVLSRAFTLTPRPTPLSPKLAPVVLGYLVQLGEETLSPTAAVKAILPQQRATETSVNPNARRSGNWCRSGAPIWNQFTSPKGRKPPPMPPPQK